MTKFTGSFLAGNKLLSRYLSPGLNGEMTLRQLLLFATVLKIASVFHYMD